MENLRPKDPEDDQRDQRRRKKLQPPKRYGTKRNYEYVHVTQSLNAVVVFSFSNCLNLFLQTSGKGRGRPKKNPEPAAFSDEKSGEEEQE